MTRWVATTGPSKSMINQFLQFIKPLALTLIVIGFLQVTGLWSNATATAQLLVMKTGLLNIDVEESDAPAIFDYGFSVKDLSGNQISFDAYRGKVLFINLWATWCGPCKAEMPGIQHLSEKLKDQPVTFVMISVDKESSFPKVKSYIENNQFTFPVFMPHGYLPDFMQVPSIPTTFVVSKDGKIIMKEVGSRNYDTNKMRNFLIKQASK